MTMGTGGIFGNPNRFGMNGLPPILQRKPQFPGFDEAGMPQVEPGMAPKMEEAPMPAVLQPEAKPGAFANGGMAWKILGLIGDGMQVADGGQASYLPTVLDLEKQVAEEKRFQAKLAADIEAAARAANAPTANMREYYFRQRLSPEEQAAFDRSRAGDPNIAMTLPGDRGIYAGPQSGLAAALTPQSVQRPAPTPPPTSQDVIPFEAFKGAVQTQGIEWAKQHFGRMGVPVGVRSPEEARQLPSGTEYITPDGRKMRIP